MEDQNSMKREYDRQHSMQPSEQVRNEMQQKFDLVIHGSVKDISQIGIMYNEKTGEKRYYQKG